MFTWIGLAVVAQVIGAAVALVDKYIVTHDELMPKPFVYAFYTCLLSGVWIAVFFLGLLPLPFIASLGVPSLTNIALPDLTTAALSMLAAYTFFIALVSLYTALREGDASDVIPVVGAVSAITSFALGYSFLGTRLTHNFMIGIALLALGTFLVSHLRFRWHTALVSIHAGIFFAAHYVALKGLFDLTDFDNGFFWSRIAFFVVALSTLMVPGHLLRIHGQTKVTTRRGSLLVVGNKLLAGVGSILILKATSLGSVAVVQALGGLQFIFILLFTFFWGHKTPVECGEDITCGEDIYHKVIFISIIALGFVVLFV